MPNNLANQLFINIGKETAVAATFTSLQVVDIFRGKLLTDIPGPYRAIVGFARDIVGNQPPQPFTVKVDLMQPQRSITADPSLTQGTLFVVRSDPTARMTPNGKRKK